MVFQTLSFSGLKRILRLWRGYILKKMRIRTTQTKNVLLLGSTCISNEEDTPMLFSRGLFVPFSLFF